MNGNLLITLLSVWWCVLPFSSGIKNGKPLRGTGTGLVNIFQWKNRVCSGVVLDKNWILTAGKCIDDRYLDTYRLSLRTKDGRDIGRRVLYTERPANSTDVVLIKTTQALKKKDVRKLVILRNSASEDYSKCKLQGYSDMGQQLAKTRLTDVKARCDNDANDNSLCFDAKTPAAVCSCLALRVDLLNPGGYRGTSMVPDISVTGTCWTRICRRGCIGTGISGIRIAFHERWIRQVLDADNDCQDLRKRGITTSGSYTVQLWKTGLRIQVYCDMETDGGGWTVFQNRFNGSVDFNQNLIEYENGFGDLGGEFWTGLRYVQEMAQLDTTELRLDVSTANQTTFYSVFQNFHLGFDNRYELNIGARSGSVVNPAYASLYDALGSCFSTRDRDCDEMYYYSVASLNLAGWWFHGGIYVFLNGLYATPGIVHALSTPTGPLYRGIYHVGFSSTEALSSSKMMFRRVQLSS